MNELIQVLHKNISNYLNFDRAFKPIIHNGDIVYVLDGDIRYEFRMAEVDEESRRN
jgi:hypothetical protein